MIVNKILENPSDFFVDRISENPTKGFPYMISFSSLNTKKQIKRFPSSSAFYAIHFLLLIVGQLQFVQNIEYKA